MINEIVDNLPQTPGVYIMHNSEGKIIYVGKAKNLHKRVSQYFLKDRDAKTRALVSHIHNIEYIITGNEYEALILENNLIKKHKPKYNIDLKDGKTYQMIRITDEDFPKIFKTRRLVNDGSQFFGPYPKGYYLDEFMKLIYNSYKIRRCSIPLKKRATPCLYYHINKCSAPCCGYISKNDYNKEISECKKLLQGHTDSIKEELTKEMKKLSSEYKFEEAAKKRDLISSLDAITSPQSVELNSSTDAYDYVAIATNGPIVAVAIMQLRSGSLLGKAVYRAETFAENEDILINFLTQYYNSSKDIPNEIFISEEIDSEILSLYFKEHLKDVVFSFPTDGRHYRALRLAEQNAKDDVAKRLRKSDNKEALIALQNHLALPKLPLLIEGYDIAQLSGKYTVASLISYKDGLKNKDGYRRFNIKSLDGKIDDFGAMREAITRRYKRVILENLQRPDLLLIDGGKGQVNVAREVLDDLGMAETAVVGLAKSIETIVFDDDREDLVLDHSDPGLRLLIEIRDECHRFATTANQNARSSDAHFKLLCSIDGIGEKRAKDLMKEFVSVENLISTPPEEIQKRAGVPYRVAERILKEFKE